MKVYQLLEAERPQLITWLWEHCTPYLTELGLSRNDDLHVVEAKAKLYRGLTIETPGQDIEFETSWGDEVEGTVLPVRKDRIPRDTHMDLSNVVDDMLENKFGWRPRQQGLFATGRPSLAGNYGRVFRIFPMGEFKYVWNPKVRDLTLKLADILKGARITHRDVGDDYTKDELADMYEVISDNLEGDYKDTDINQIMGTSFEVMISCDKYLAIPTD